MDRETTKSIIQKSDQFVDIYNKTLALGDVLKLTELTNNAILDSMELNDIRAEIAGLRAEVTDLKSQLEMKR